MTDVRVDIEVGAPIERAFAVFTTRCGSWWPRDYHLGEHEWDDVIIEPFVGGRWFERAAEGRTCDWGRVLEWEEPNRVVLSWQIAPDYTPEPDSDRASRVEVTFAVVDDDTTAVTVVHSDFERHGEGWESMRESVAGGWPGIMDNFGRVAKGA